MDLNDAILDEMCKAAERLGGDGEEIRALPQARIYDALDDLGADRYLLAVVGSWGDTGRRSGARFSPALEPRRATARPRHRQHGRT
jgi:hypothetical protein